MTDWTEVVRQHGPLVWRTAYRLLNNEADASDCFQRTFVSALELSRNEPICNWAPLLRRLTTARALDRLRQKRRQASRETELPEEGSADSKATDPAQAAEARELAERLRGALTQLDARQGEVFCLACLEGLSYQEIAEQLGVTVNHVGVLLNRARQGLRERLQAHKPAAAKERFGNEVKP